MMEGGTTKVIVQWSFAMSPFPSYLPQYLAILQSLNDINATATVALPNSLSSPSDHSDTNSNGNTSNTNSLEANTSIDRTDDHHFLRKRLHAPPTDSSTALIGTPSKASTNSHEWGQETGLSPATVLLLLSAHLIRMLYFHGVLLEEQQQRTNYPRASAGRRLDRWSLPRHHSWRKAIDTTTSNTLTLEEELQSSKPTASHNALSSFTQPSALRLDLLGQSCSMIVVQLMLLHGMLRLRQKNQKRQRKKSANGFETLDCNQHSGTAGHCDTVPHKSNIRFPLAPLTQYTFFQRQCQTITRGTTAHFLDLVSPVNIVRHHSFLQHLELLFLSSMTMKLLFDYHWYPIYRIRIVECLKLVSIGLESCLAVPQAIRNYRRGTTEGLSLVMVGGWVAGDFFKLCYFLVEMMESEKNRNAVDREGSTIFALGSLLALVLDLIVAMQMLWWYPTPEVSHVVERIVRSIPYKKSRRGGDSKALLIGMSPEFKEAGSIVSVVHAFFALFQKRENCNQSLD